MNPIKAEEMELVKVMDEVTCTFKLENTQVVLKFSNGKFESGTFPFADRFDREKWKMQSNIILKIEQIEKKLQNNKIPRSEDIPKLKNVVKLKEEKKKEQAPIIKSL